MIWLSLRAVRNGALCGFGEMEVRNYGRSPITLNAQERSSRAIRNTILLDSVTRNAYYKIIKGEFNIITSL
jgi:hypothetical protein